jgi:hypothetical protein
MNAKSTGATSAATSLITSCGWPLSNVMLPMKRELVVRTSMFVMA